MHKTEYTRLAELEIGKTVASEVQQSSSYVVQNVTTARRLFRLQVEETASRYGS
jgi:hypothetical protein